MADPFSSLTENKYRLSTYRYPENLGNDPTRNHWVTFQINETVPAKFGQPNQSATRGGQQFTLFGQSFAISPPIQRLAGEISLYMPDTVNVSYDQSYQEDNLSDYTVTYYGQALGSAFEDRGKIIDGLTSNPLNTLSSNPEILAVLRRFTGDLIPTDVLLKGQGLAINPQVQLLFKATALRSFQFDFLLTPTSPQESESIKNIIDKFKYHAAPLIGTGSTGAGLFFVMPDTFNVIFYYAGAENKKIHKIDECVLEGIDVDYAPSGWATFDDGSPAQIRLRLVFKELNIQDKNKILQGY